MQVLKDCTVYAILGLAAGLMWGCADTPPPPLDWRTLHQPAPQTPGGGD